MLIILFPEKFISSFYKNYHVDDLKKKLKDKIEVHDLSNIISTTTNNTYKRSNNKSVKVFKDIKQWKRYLNNKIKKKKKFML